VLAALSAGSLVAAAVDVEQMPGRDQILRRLGDLADIHPGVTALENGDFAGAAKLARGYVDRKPTDAKAHLLLILAWYGQGDDGRIGDHLDEVAVEQPALGASLRETVAGLYLRDGRLYRAGEQLAALPAERRTDQCEFLAAAIAGRQGKVDEAQGRIDKLSEKIPGNVALAVNQSRLALMAADNDGTGVPGGTHACAAGSTDLESAGREPGAGRQATRPHGRPDDG
jgi:hypothetical protein